MRNLVHAFKYGGRRDLLAPLGRTLAGSPRLAALCGPGAPVVVPLPARRRSLRRRGYDQAALLAEGLAAEWRLCLAPTTLCRRRQREDPQAGSTLRQRLRRARAAFAVRGGLEGRDVLLVDDVLATGASADSAARALRRAGARAVRVLVLAT